MSGAQTAAALGGCETDGSLVSAWLVGDDVSAAEEAEFFETLDADERRRADRLDTTRARRRFIVAHGAVRRIVADHLGTPPADLTRRIGRHGKPELPGVQVNYSHSGGLCLVALSATRQVGADIQRLVPGLDVTAMARRYFPADEARAVAEGGSDVFTRLWARKEAVCKAFGGRLTQVLPLPVAGDVVQVGSSGYRVVDLCVPAGFRAAVALSGAEPFRVELV
ncbi:MAG: 4'-phosphopantetheinyl transferase family protein [Catenulispora sp.]